MIQERVVERPGTIGVALGDARDEPDLVLAGDVAEPVRRLAGDLERLACEHRESLLRAGFRPAREGARPDRGGIGGDERLRKDQQPGAVAGSLGGKPGELLNRGVPVQDDRLRLHARHGHRGAHRVILRH